MDVGHPQKSDVILQHSLSNEVCIHTHLCFYLAVITAYGVERFQCGLFCRELAQSTADIRVFSSSTIGKYMQVCGVCVHICVCIHTYV